MKLCKLEDGGELRKRKRQPVRAQLRAGQDERLTFSRSGGQASARDERTNKLVRSVKLPVCSLNKLRSTLPVQTSSVSRSIQDTSAVYCAHAILMPSVTQLTRAVIWLDNDSLSKPAKATSTVREGMKAPNCRVWSCWAS